jgi:hypothetical protein
VLSAERARRPPSAEGALARDQRRGVEAAEAERGELAPLPACMLSLRAPAMSLNDPTQPRRQALDMSAVCDLASSEVDRSEWTQQASRHDS